MSIEEEAKQNIQNMVHEVADFCKTMGFEFEVVHDDEEEEYDEVEYEEINLYREHKGYKNVNGYAVPIEDEEEYDEDKEAREYEGGKEDYLYDNYVADQLESEDK